MASIVHTLAEPAEEGANLPVPSAEAVDSVLKAVVAGARPAYTRNMRADSARRYSMLHSGILEDSTPHIYAAMLRHLTERNVVIQAVLQTLINQVASRFRKPENEKGLGLRVVQKDRQKDLTEASAREAQRIGDILLRGGVHTKHPITGEPAAWDGRYERKADPLSTAIRKLTRDTLTLDRIFVSIEGSAPLGGSRANPVMHWIVEDAALMRMTDSAYYSPKIRPELDGQVAYVMLDPGGFWGVVREYRWDEGLMAFRNPRTDFATFGYGKSEVEQCLDAVIGVIYAMKHNKNYFTDSHIPQGILNLIGGYSQQQLDGLQLVLDQEIGFQVGGDYKIPVLKTPAGPGVQGAQWVSMMDRARMDMVFRAYLEFCVTLVSAVFQIAPEEFGFSGFGGPTSALQEPDPSSTFMQSQSRGLVPKVLFLGDYLTKAVVEKINPDFEIIIQGLESNYNPEYLLEEQLDQARITNGWTRNEIQALRDLPPIIDPKDPDLWERVAEAHEKKWYPSETVRIQAVLDDYKDLGGEIARWPDAPWGAPGALEIWSQEMQIGAEQQAQDQMGQMAQSADQGDHAEQQAGMQSAQAGMQAFQDNEQQQDFQNQANDQQDQRDAEMRIPMAEDAGLLRRRRARKSLRVFLTQGRVKTRGPRDAS
jgi:hypothetical protein